MIQRAGAFAQAVHGPHRRADVYRAYAKTGGAEGADGAAAGEVAAMGVFLERNFGLAAVGDELRLCLAIGGVVLIGVDFNHRPLIDEDFVVGFVSARIIGVIGMRHVGANNEAVRQGALPIHALAAAAKRYALQYIAEETAAGALGAVAADFFMVEKSADAGGVRFGAGLGQQRGQTGVAGGQIVQLPVGDEFLLRAP